MGVASLSYTIDGKPIRVPCDQDRVTLGRSKEMTVVIPENVSGVSRHHATLRRYGAQWILEDAQSSYGTFLHDSKITSAALQDGDRIRLGRFELTFSTRPPQSPVPPAGTQSKAADDSHLLRPAVTFGETACSQVNVSIDLANLELHHGPSRSMRSIAQGWLDSRADAAPGQASSEKEHAVSSQRFGPDQVWAISLFSEVGRAMQTSTDLDGMLEQLLNLIFTQVRADSAVIGLLDHQTQGVIPKAVRSADGKTKAGSGQGVVTVSNTVLRTALSSMSAIVVDDVTADERFNHAASLQFSAVRSVMCVPLYQDGRVHGVIYLDSCDRHHSFGERDLEIVTALALFSAISIEQFGLRAKSLEQQRQRERLARYITPAVVDRIMGAGDEAHMLADKEEVTVLFSDLRGFTSLSEKLPPAEVVEILNAVLSRLTDAIFRNQGTLDKFMGDGLMAFFGAPLRDDDHPRQAVRAAHDMLTALEEFNQGRPDEAKIGIRIGVNTGPVIVGDIGSISRKDYTVIGDTVNVASRFESSVAQVNQIVIGPATYAALGDEFTCEALPPATLKGRSEPIQPYRVVSRDPITRLDLSSPFREKDNSP
jgi:adenylate cyclase